MPQKRVKAIIPAAASRDNVSVPKVKSAEKKRKIDPSAVNFG